MAVEILDYDHARDWTAVERIYREVGWIEDESDAKIAEQEAQHRPGVVFPIDGEAECAVFTAPGAMRHLETDLDMTVVASVTTSRIARRLGAAKALTAHVLAQAAEQGSEVAALSMFDQGFYDRIGFGTGAYAARVHFDPATLVVEAPFRPPKRLGAKHWREVYGAMFSRQRGHGSCVLHTPEITRAHLSGTNYKDFCLGFFDGPDGALSHFIWGEVEGEHGPYNIWCYAYRNAEQLFELLALIKSLGDQVSSFSMEEPPEIQFQDLLRQPFRQREVTRGSKHASDHHTVAYGQARMLDVPRCLAKTHIDAADLRFNLRLTDPIASSLDGKHQWQGVAGDYVVTLGEESAATPGRAVGLPDLHASVGAFTRVWLGVRNASSLALTDDIQGDPALLAELDRSLRLPRPHVGWPF